jgi:hypothetical protein
MDAAEVKIGDVFIEADPYRNFRPGKARVGRRPRIVRVEVVTAYDVGTRVTFGRGLGKPLSIPKKHLGVHWRPSK